jgi:hypothetical protein
MGMNLAGGRDQYSLGTSSNSRYRFMFTVQVLDKTTLVILL